MHPSEAVRWRSDGLPWLVEQHPCIQDWMFKDALPPITLHPSVLEAIDRDRAMLRPF